MSFGSIESGLEKVTPNVAAAARTLGRSPMAAFIEVHLPLLRPALVSAALLVFVDCMKELPATLLLRPLNFETLSTHLYGEAARGTYEDGAIAALCIVLVGLIPVMLLARLSRRPALAYDARPPEARPGDTGGDLSAILPSISPPPASAISQKQER